MDIIVRSYNELQPLTSSLPAEGRLSLPEGETVGGVLARLALPAVKMTELVLFVNGRAAQLQTRLTEGDTLVFFSSIAGG